MNRTLRALQRRLLQAVPIILAIVAINFLLLNLAPGDMVDVMAAEEQIAEPEVRERLRVEYGLDQPLGIQLARYVWSAARLDLIPRGQAQRDVLGALPHERIQILDALVGRSGGSPGLDRLARENRAVVLDQEALALVECLPAVGTDVDVVVGGGRERVRVAW